LVSERVYGNR